MPWSDTSPMEQKVQFIADWIRGLQSFSDLCDAYGISRKTGYKFVNRYLELGPEGLEERGRRPHRSPKRTSQHVEEAIVESRRRHPTWGPKKLLKILSAQHPDWTWPARSTVAEILKRNDLIKPKRRRRKIGHPGKPCSVSEQANEIWTVDFKGEFKTRDGLYCYPLTVCDDYSRYLLGCQGLLSTRVDGAKVVFRRLFKAYGLPRAIKSDNGVPFATNTLGRLSRLSAWWVRLGITPMLIEPGKPQQNGRHERMHRTLKYEATIPPSANQRTQQRRFNIFRREFNEIRPHEALGQDCPASLYRPSERQMPDRLEPLEYPAHFEVRYVSANGGMRWKRRWVNVSQTCVGEYIGLEEIDVGTWNVYFGSFKIGRFHEKHMRIEDQYGRLKRLKV